MEIFQQTLWQNIYVWKRATLEPFPAHFHGYVEVLYIKRGGAVCSVNFKEYTLRAGDILFVFPDTVHEVVSTEADSENIILFFPKEISFFGESFDAAMPKNPVICTGGDAEIGGLFESALKSYDNLANKYARGEALGYILLLLSKLFSLVELCEVTRTEKGFERKVIEYCSSHFAEPIKLTDVAREMGYAPSYFSDVFSEKFKGGFSNFLNTLRVEEAKKQLHGDGSISDIAFGCGFGSIRTFNRVFKEQTGKTPKEYREKL